MASRTALVLETNPVITERYLDYTHDSDWRIMLKDTMNGFLEKLQQEKFNLIVAEESLVPQGIIQMMKASGIPLILSSNTKNAEIQTLPRNFNRTELLTVFDRLVPPVLDEFKENDYEKTETVGENDKDGSILSDLEDDDDDFFELSSNDVILEPSNGQHSLHDSPQAFETADQDDDFMTFDSVKTEETAETPAQHIEEPVQNDEKSSEGNLFAPPPLFDDNSSEIDDLVHSLTVDLKPREPESTTGEFQMEAEEPQEEEVSSGTPSGTLSEAASPDEIKAAVTEWLDKNARGIIKEIVLQELASLSGKNND